MERIFWSFAGTDEEFPGFVDLAGKVWIENRDDQIKKVVEDLPDDEAARLTALSDEGHSPFLLPEDWQVEVSRPRPLWKEEFPDFDNGEALETILSALSKFGFRDHSWHNEAMPRLMMEISEEVAVSIWINYAGRELREFPDMAPVSVAFGDPGGDSISEIELASTNIDFVLDAVQRVMISGIPGFDVSIETPVLPRLSAEMTTAELTAKAALFSVMTDQTWRSADEMIFEIEEDNPDRPALRAWLVQFVEFWSDAEEREIE